VLIYVVDLTNPTDRPVSLSPCPVYIQAATSPTPVKDIEALNCTSVGSIAAHATTRFEMHMQMAAGAPTGGLRIVWSLKGPDVPAVASTSFDLAAPLTTVHS
jgi:hypothetical protein